jgi:hypothetical protein
MNGFWGSCGKWSKRDERSDPEIPGENALVFGGDRIRCPDTLLQVPSELPACGRRVSVPRSSVDATKRKFLLHASLL